MSEALEERLRAVVADVAGSDGRDLDLDQDLLLALGLDSLTGLRVLARIEQRFAVRLPDRQLGELRTLRQLAAAVRAAGGEEAS